MVSPFDASALTEVEQGIYLDKAQGFLITNVAQLKERFEGKIQKLQTQEMKLESLGSFPLPKEALPLMTRVLRHEGIDLVVPEILRKSHIPIFADATKQVAYLSAEGKNICRYFFDLWRLTDDIADSENDEILAGFTILASYSGI